MRNGATAYKPPRLFYVRSTAVERRVGLMFFQCGTSVAESECGA